MHQRLRDAPILLLFVVVKSAADASLGGHAQVARALLTARLLRQLPDGIETYRSRSQRLQLLV